MLFPFPLELFPLTFPLVAQNYSHSNGTHGNPMGMGIPIPMHTSNRDLMWCFQFCVHRCYHTRWLCEQSTQRCVSWPQTANKSAPYLTLIFNDEQRNSVSPRLLTDFVYMCV